MDAVADWTSLPGSISDSSFNKRLLKLLDFQRPVTKLTTAIIPGHYEICVAGTLPLDQALNFEVDVHDDCIDAQPEDILTVRLVNQQLGRLPSGEPGPCWLRSQTVEVIAMKFGIVNS